MEACISLKPESLVNDRGGGGFSINIPGYQGNPNTKDPEQIFIEIYDGALRIHVWNGQENPTTIICNKINPQKKV